MKSVVITGSEGLIGTALCRELVDMSIPIYPIDLSKNNNNNNKQRYLSIDLSDSEDTSVQISSYIKGIEKPFTLIHSAGIDFKCPKNSNNEIDPFQIMPEDPETFKDIISKNISMTYNVIYPVIKKMLSVKGGTILLLGSIYGEIASNPNLYKNKDGSFFMNKPFSYSISKSTFSMFAKLIASRYASKNINAINIAPHAIINNANKEFSENFKEFSPSKTFCELADLTDLLIYHSQRPFSYLNGSTIIMDGGWSAI